MAKEYVITNILEVEGIVAEIKSNFDKVESEREQITVKFNDNISKNDFLEALKILFDYEICSGFTIDILIKNLSYDYRKEALSLALKTPELKDPIFLMNVFCLIKGYNTFDESYFEHEQVFLNDEVEFLDIFDDLE